MCRRPEGGLERGGLTRSLEKGFDELTACWQAGVLAGAGQFRFQNGNLRLSRNRARFGLRQSCAQLPDRLIGLGQSDLGPRCRSQRFFPKSTFAASLFM